MEMLLKGAALPPRAFAQRYPRQRKHEGSARSLGGGSTQYARKCDAREKCPSCCLFPSGARMPNYHLATRTQIWCR